jgi:hypothetical protein
VEEIAREVKEIVRNKGLHEDAQLKDLLGSVCKVYVLLFYCT